MPSPSRTSFFRAASRGLIPVAALLAVAACSNEQPTEAAVAPSHAQVAVREAEPVADAPVVAPRERPFKPEMLVRFPESSPLCLTKEHLAEYMMHGLKGEETKMRAMFVEHDGEQASCLMIRPDAVVRVIGVEYNDPDGDIGLLEVALPNSITPAGLWTLTVAAVPAEAKTGKSKR